MAGRCARAAVMTGGTAASVVMAAAAPRARMAMRPGRALHTGADIWRGPAVLGAHVDSYYSRTTPWASPPAAASPPLDGDVRCDTVVIGGGFAGVNVALSLAERGQRVVVLESNRVGWAASGRNGGFAHPGYSLNMFDLERAVGISHTRALWNLTFDSLGTMRERVRRWSQREGGGPGAALAASVAEGMVTASWFDDAAGVRAEVEGGNRILGRDYFQFWDRSRVNATYATPRYYDAVYDPDSFHFHSLNYAQCVAREAVELGAQIYERTAASELTLGRAGEGGITVTTDRGYRVMADQTVICGSAYMPRLRGVGQVTRAVLPVMTYACVTEPLGEDRLHALMKARHCVTDSRFACDYYRPLPDTRILWGGRIDCLGIDTGRLASVLHEDMVKVYPQLEQMKVDVAWPGVMGYARHKMPLLGRLPNMEGVWYCTGFGGHGVCPTTVAGDLIASAIASGDQRYKLFKPFTLQWTGGPLLGSLAAQAFYWAYELRDWYRELRVNKGARLASPGVNRMG